MSEVGQGGMSTVFEAEDVRHHRLVAIKVLRPEMTGGIGAERFLREIETSARLNHPHILPLLDSGQVENLLYYVMPLVEGETLRQHMERTGPLPLDFAIRLAAEIADGLAYAHRSGLVHRDIKPENVLLSSGHAVIMDFGIARALDQAGNARLTRTGSVTGTPAYMSPEQWEGVELDGRSDQYSLGCVLYEMLAGERPFEGRTTTAIMTRHLQAPAPSICDARVDVPDHVDAAIRRAMAKAPDDRFAESAAFAAALLSATAPTSRKPALQLLRGLTTRRALVAAMVAVTLAAAGYLVRARFAASSASAAPMKLVVLPFNNVGPVEDAYFADGISDEITNRLAGIASLGVIARSSAVQYRNSPKSPREIGQELGVDYLIEGSVSWDQPGSAAGRVRVSGQLIKTSDGTVVWPFDTTAASSNVFEIQSGIAEQVASRLNLLLRAPERRRLTAQYTDNLEAYDNYLRGNTAYERSWARPDVEAALEYYEKAVSLDPSYALAWAKLARTHAWIHQLRIDFSADRLVAAKKAADQAMALDPELSEAHIALGLYWYWGLDNYDRAVAEFTRAGELQPSNAQVYLQIGNVRRRQGRFEEAIDSYRRTADLDPKSRLGWFNLGETLLFTRQYEESAPYLARVTDLSPDFLEGYVQQARLAINEKGDRQTAREIINTAELRIPATAWRSPMLDFRRIINDEDLGSFIERLRPGAYGLDSATYHLMKARLLSQTRGEAAAVTEYDSARAQLELLRDEEPGQAWVHGLLGVAYAGVGRSGDAIRSARRAMELLPVSRDALDGPEWVYNLAGIYLMLGDIDKAVACYDAALSIPSWISVNSLVSDPALALIRENPQFQKLKERWGPAGGVVGDDEPARVPACA